MDVVPTAQHLYHLLQVVLVLCITIRPMVSPSPFPLVRFITDSLIFVQASQIFHRHFQMMYKRKLEAVESGNGKNALGSRLHLQSCPLCSDISTPSIVILVLVLASPGAETISLWFWTVFGCQLSHICTPWYHASLLTLLSHSPRSR